MSPRRWTSSPTRCCRISSAHFQRRANLSSRSSRSQATICSLSRGILSFSVVHLPLRAPPGIRRHLDLFRRRSIHPPALTDPGNMGEQIPQTVGHIRIGEETSPRRTGIIPDAEALRQLDLGLSRPAGDGQEVFPIDDLIFPKPQHRRSAPVLLGIHSQAIDYSKKTVVRQG